MYDDVRTTAILPLTTNHQNSVSRARAFLLRHKSRRKSKQIVRTAPKVRRDCRFDFVDRKVKFADDDTITEFII